MSALRFREKFGLFVCITLLIILSCRGVQSQKDEEEPEPEPASNILKRNMECDFSDPKMCGYIVWLAHGSSWARMNTTSGYVMSFKTIFGKSYLISPYKNLTDSCVQTDYKIRGGRRCMLDITTHPERKLKFRLTSSSVGRAQFYVKNAVISVRFMAESHHFYPVTCHIRIEKVSIRSGTCPALVCPYETRACLDQSKCISYSSFCDDIPDCPDKSDEASCQRSIECDFSDPIICGYEVRGEYGFRWSIMKATSGYVMSFKTFRGKSDLISPYKNLTDSCVQIDYKISGGRRCMLAVTTDPDKKLKFRLASSSVGRAQFYVKNAVIAIRFMAESNHIFHVICHIQIEKVSIRNGTCPALVCPYETRACLDQSKCISHSKFCDRIPDCPDKSDEASCQ